MDNFNGILSGYIQRWRCVLACFLLALFWLVCPVEAEHKMVRVGWFEDSYNITDDCGQRRGYGYEFQQAVASYTGWNYQYVKANWSDLIKMMENGDIDMMSGISYTDDRATKMLFSDLPMGEERYYLYANLKETGIYPSQLETLNEKKVGLLSGSIQATKFYEWEKKHDLHMVHVPISGLEDAFKKLNNQEIDCLVSAETPELTEVGMSAIATVGGSNIYFVVTQNRPDLKAELDTAMRQLDSDNPFFADELYKRYLSSVTRPVLFRNERQWLAQHGLIRIGWIKNDSGISVADSAQGEPVGIINDYVRYAENSLGRQPLQFELVGFDSITEEIKALQDGKIDMIFHFVQNPYLAEQYDLSLSQPALSINMVAVTKQDSFNENNKNRVGIVRNDVLYRGYITYNYPDWEIVEYDSLDDVKQAARKGEVDCYVAKVGWAMAQGRSSEMHSVMLMQPNDMAFAVDHRNTELASILNKTLKVLPAAMLPSAFSMYTNNAKQITIADFVRDNLLTVVLVVGASFVITLGVILSFLRKSKKAEKVAKEAAYQSSELNKKLQENHEALEKALQRAEEASAAKTTFLFNMSHDIRTPMNALLGYAKLIKQELTDPKLLDYEKKMEQAGNLLLAIINNVLDMARIESGKMELDESYNYVGDILSNVYSVFDVEAKKKGIHFSRKTEVKHHHILCDVTKVQEIFANLVNNAIKYTPSGGSIYIHTQEIPCEEKGYVLFRTDVTDTGIGMSPEYIPHIFEAFTRERNTTMSKVAGTGLGMAIVKKLVEMMHGTLDVKSQVGKGSTFTVILKHRIADKAYYDKIKAIASDIGTKEKLKGKHILLAEDNDLNAEIATVLLQQMGLKVDRVEDGIQCVNHLEKEPAGTYDLILMDVQMPRMDGYQATHAIRQFADIQKANIPIVAMTANAFDEDRKMAIDQGMNDHIAKPIDVVKVEKVLLSLLK